MKDEGGDILPEDEMEIVYASIPHYPLDFHPPDTKSPSYLPHPPPLSRFSIPFDFVTKICKSETCISPAMLIFRPHGERGEGEGPTFLSSLERASKV